VIAPGTRAVFDYPQAFVTLPEYSAHRGQEVTVVRQCTSQEADQECQHMYVIQASDGWTGVADEDELLESTNKEVTMTSSGNVLAPVPPERDAAGLTAEEFLVGLFEYEYCESCGRDKDDHTAVIGPFGLWFAYCLKDPKEGD
jgi:hypothetical protein